MKSYLHLKEENIIKKLCKFKEKEQASVDQSGNSNKNLNHILLNDGVTLLRLMEVICTLWAEDWLKARNLKSTRIELIAKRSIVNPYFFQTIH